MNLQSTARGERFDRAIAAALGRASVREVRRALEAGRILVNGRTRAPGEKATGDEEITFVDFEPRQDATPVANPTLAASIPVLFRDDHLLVLDKPSGLPSGPIRPGENQTLLAAAIGLDPAVGQAGPPLEGGLAHRLDTGTSGVVVFARDRGTWEALRADFRAHRIEKVYLALVHGEWIGERSLTGAIGPGTRADRVRVAEAEEDPDALPAHTDVVALRTFSGGTLVRATTRTGRRHQIRAHLAAAGFPLLGDPIYGPTPTSLARLGLHAHRLTLADGRSFTAAWPTELQAVGGGAEDP
ncbi:MAG: RluA family pseudouridine synthase [Deltaproteobacteria bacterium]|nr:RluA family pseudouridine synthase [Deltaproteobacteria bacterium]